MDNRSEKLLGSIREALEKCGIRDGMCLSFHHHLREGDYVCAMVMEEVHAMGIKDITICASSLGNAQKCIVPMMEDGTVTGIWSSGVRGAIGEAISAGKLKNVAVLYSHGGRVRSIEEGEIHIDIAFIAAPTCDAYGNLRAVGGKSDCGVLSYAVVDSEYADKVVAVTDCFVDGENLPASIPGERVDYIVCVDSIGDPEKIASGAAKPTTDMRKKLMAKYCTDVVINTDWYKDGFSYQTGVGGASIASTAYLADCMRRDGITMSFALGGISTPMAELLEEGLCKKIYDTQDFDLGAIESIRNNPNQIEISAGDYACPTHDNYVNKMDYVILAALEVDCDFNCNVVVNSQGIISGAQGGHPDTAAGSKCTIVITNLLQGRSPAVRTKVTTVTTPGDTIDVVVTEYGIAVNPKRADILNMLEGKGLPLKTIEELRDEAYKIAGEPADVEFEDRVVAIIQNRNGGQTDVVRQAKEW